MAVHSAVGRGAGRGADPDAVGNNILSPAHGAPLATPAQDMVLGAYYLTYGPDGDELAKIDPATHRAAPDVFRTAQEAEWSYEHGVVKLHDLAEYRPLGCEGGHVLTTVGRIIYNDKIERALGEALGDNFDPSQYEFVNRSMRKKDTTKLVDDLVQKYGAASISQVLDAFKDVGFHYATQAGVTVSKNDVQTPPNKAGDPRPVRRRAGRDRRASTTTARWIRRSATRRSPGCGIGRPTRSRKAHASRTSTS